MAPSHGSHHWSTPVLAYKTERVALRQGVSTERLIDGSIDRDKPTRTNRRRSTDED
jgi:hypothetical protein